MSPSIPKNLVFFDGECGFCDHTVQWLLARDAKENLYFTPLQGDLAQEVLVQFDLPPDLDSIVYVRTEDDGPKVFIYSAAIGEILKELPFPWSWLRVGWIVPTVVRDWCYKQFAARRLAWFGTTGVDACRLPDERQAQRLLM